MEKENENLTVDVEQVQAQAKTKASENELARMKALNEAFPDDPEFAIKAFTEGKSLEQAKADYCDVLREKLKVQAAAPPEQKADGVPPISTEDTDTTGTGDFIAEARELADKKKITVTAAMKIVKRRNPKLHEQFKQRCETEGKAMCAEAG